GLPLKGRIVEATPPRPADDAPTGRKQPRRPDAVPEPPDAAEYARLQAAALAELTAMLTNNGYVGPRVQSNDRIRPLVYSSAVAVDIPLADEAYAPRLEPKPPEIVAVRVVEGFAAPTRTYPNRWFIFPGLPFRRYDNKSL